VTRNTWQPFFSHDSIAQHGKLMADSADKLCTLLRTAAEEGRVVDIWRECGKLTLDVVGTTAFGVR
jgi:cytochrome P450